MDVDTQPSSSKIHDDEEILPDDIQEDTFIDDEGKVHVLHSIKGHVKHLDIQEDEARQKDRADILYGTKEYVQHEKNSYKKYWTPNGPNLYKTKSPNFVPLKPNAKDDYSRWARKPIEDEYRQNIKESDLNLVVVGCKATYHKTTDVMNRLQMCHQVDNQKNDGKSIWSKNSDRKYASSRIKYLSKDLDLCSSWKSELEKHQVPVIHLFCLDDQGRSLCINVHGFFPYIYTEVDERLFSSESDLDANGKDLCERFALSIEKWAQQLGNKKRYWENKKDKDSSSSKNQDWEKSNRNYGGFVSGNSFKDDGGSDDEEEGGYKRRNNTFRPSNGNDFSKSEKTLTQSYVVSIRIVKKIALDGGHKEIQPMFQIQFATPIYIAQFRTEYMKTGFPISFRNKTHTFGGPDMANRKGERVEALTFDSCIRFENRFLIDKELHGGCWFKIPKTSNKQVRYYEDDSMVYEREYHWKDFSQCISRSQIEIDIHYSSIEAYGQYKPENATMYANPVAGVRVMSFDIECIGERCRFPDPKKDPLVCINVYATKDSRYPTVFSSKEEDYNKPDKIHERDQIISVCFSVSSSEFDRKNHVRKKPVLRGYSDPNPTIFTFKDEKEMLNAFCQFINIFDPDVITGYNTSNFDIPQVVQRCEVLGIKDVLHCSRLLSETLTYREETKQHKKNGAITFKVQECPGRLTWDVLPFIRADVMLKFSSYSLNYVSKSLFKETKDDIDHLTLPIYYRSGAKFRDVVRVYCERDAFLALRIFNVRQIWTAGIEASRVSGTRLEQEQGDGAAAKAFPHITRSSTVNNFVIPWRIYERGEKYEGAIVQDPVKGFHDKLLIVFFDYLSEYPCMIRAWNICMSTYISPEKWPETMAKYGPDCCNVCPFLGHRFLKKEIREGILPQVETFLMNRRAFVKTLMKSMVKDSDEYKVGDSRQNQLKVKANGLYGITGVINNGILWMKIAESVTAWARDQIGKTVELLSKLSDELGLGLGEFIKIYGDTDSIVATFAKHKYDPRAPKEVRDKAFEDFFADMTILAKVITERMARPNELKAEYFVYPMLLVNRKKYAILMRENPKDKPRIEIKGLETKRRNTCIYTADTQMECIKILMEDVDVDKAFKYAVQRTKDLATYNFNLSDLIISTRLNKIPDFERDTKNVRPQEYLFQRMREADPNAIPNLGDRIPYLIREGDLKSQKNFSKVIHPTELLGKNAQNIDIQYYFEKQFLKPLSTLFKYIDHPNGLTWMDKKKTKTIPISDIPGFRKIDPSEDNDILMNPEHEGMNMDDVYEDEMEDEIDKYDDEDTPEVAERKLEFESRLRMEFNSSRIISNTNELYWSSDNEKMRMEIDNMIGLGPSASIATTTTTTTSSSTVTTSTTSADDLVSGLDKNIDEPMFDFPPVTTNLSESEVTTYHTNDFRQFSIREKTCLCCGTSIRDGICKESETISKVRKQSNKETDSIAYSICQSCITQKLVEGFGDKYKELHEENKIDIKKEPKKEEPKAKRGKKRKSPDSKSTPAPKSKKAKTIAAETIAVKTKLITSFFKKVEKLEPEIKMEITQPQDETIHSGSKRKHLEIEYEIQEEENKREKRRRLLEETLEQDSLQIISQIRDNISEEFQKSTQVARKKWDICKECMGDKFQKDTCSNYECSIWFQRGSITSKITSQYKKLMDLSF